MPTLGYSFIPYWVEELRQGVVAAAEAGYEGIELIEKLVIDWYAASEVAAERHRNDPEFMAMIREKSNPLRTA
jgi:hypothetical protein